MEPLTAIEKDRFVGWLDQATAQADADCAHWRARGDKFEAQKFRIKSVALQMVALILRSEQVAEASR